jgi:hypothetical protein
LLKNALGKLEFGRPQPLEIGGGAGGSGLDQQVQRILGGIGEARLEGGHARAPLEPRGESAEGTERTAALRGDRTKRAATREPKVDDEGREIGRGFTRLTLPETRHREEMSEAKG